MLPTPSQRPSVLDVLLDNVLRRLADPAVDQSSDQDWSASARALVLALTPVRPLVVPSIRPLPA